MTLQLFLLLDAVVVQLAVILDAVLVLGFTHFQQVHPLFHLLVCKFSESQEEEKAVGAARLKSDTPVETQVIFTAYSRQFAKPSIGHRSQLSVFELVLPLEDLSKGIRNAWMWMDAGWQHTGVNPSLGESGIAASAWSASFTWISFSAPPSQQGASPAGNFPTFETIHFGMGSAGSRTP